MWEKTDRPLRHAARDDTTEASTTTPQLSSDYARLRWLVENDVHTQFLDAGIGCCWFAHQGANEPVTGETEDAAIERLARENGLKLWDEPTARSTDSDFRHG
jgi:hypothetical protein